MTTYKKQKTARKPNYDRIRKEKEAKQAAKLQAIGKSAMQCIAELVRAYNPGATDADLEAALEAIEQDPLSIEVRSGWHTLGEDSTPAEYTILLSTGGPAVRIIGELNGEPTTARLEVQDWFTPWTEYRSTLSKDGTEYLNGPDEDVLLTYARCFYWGES